MKTFARQTDIAAWNKEQGQIYKLTKLICGKYRANTNIPVKDKDRKLLATVSEQDTRWAEHFKEVLNRPPPDQTSEIPEADISTYNRQKNYSN